MTDDIVTRLREAHSTFRVVVGVNQHIVFNSLHADAADEIERLRAERDRWKHWATEYLYTDPDCQCPLCDQVRDAYNAEP